MRYRVAFVKRFQSDGQESSIDPTVELDSFLADGVVAEKVFVERLEPMAQHSQEALDEDDAFLAVATPEVWEYDVVDERAGEFQDAVRNSNVVMELEAIDDSRTAPEDATAVPLSEGQGNDSPQASASSSSTTDDGPAGRPTGDPAAGGMAPVRTQFVADEVEGIGEPGSGGLDDLTVVGENDPRLGLTDSRDPEADWAAKTGPARTPGRGIETRDLTDRSSTLRQPPEKPEPEKKVVPRKSAQSARGTTRATAKKSKAPKP